jgi:hypothetical protein
MERAAQSPGLVLARSALAAVVAVLCGLPVFAEVKQSAPDGMMISHELLVKAKPEDIYAAIWDVGKWWSPSHTWSGKASNLRMEMSAGGCFCEAWGRNWVEHGRVVMARHNELVRLQAALGPLQEMAVSGVLTFSLKAGGDGTTLAVTYRVSGDSLHGLDKLAPMVDGVIGEQAARLKKFVETGAP